MNASAHDSQYKEEGDTVLESLESIMESLQASRGQTPKPVVRTAQEPTPPPVSNKPGDDSAAFKPTVRPPTPRLTILNDGEAVVGQTIWLREPLTIIGRTAGHIQIPHDPLVSGTHAEIVREGTAAPYHWILRDLGSSNGTFARFAKGVMKPDIILILGSRRFRFRGPAIAPPASASQKPSTELADSRKVLATLWPSLVEMTHAASPLEIPLRGVNLSVGRPGCGNDIELDDPLIAKHHAQIVRQPSGEWRIDSKRSKNGVWIQTSAIKLSSVCRFQCGEQRFLFEV